MRWLAAPSTSVLKDFSKMEGISFFFFFGSALRWYVALLQEAVWYKKGEHYYYTAITFIVEVKKAEDFPANKLRWIV